MRTRPIALISASLALALPLASCGGDDEPTTGASTPTPTGQAPGTSTPAPPATQPDNTPGADDTPPGGGTSAGGDDEAVPPQAPASKSDDPLGDVISETGDLTTLRTAIGAASLRSTLGQPGPYTVFAPNNDAFAKLGSQLDTLLQPSSKPTLANLLKFHVVSGQFRMADLKDGQLLTTLQGTRLRVGVEGNTITVGNGLAKGTIVSADIDASNGKVHVIDTVLAPKK